MIPILEYIISKKNPSGFLHPQFGCTVEELIELFKKNGVTKFFKWIEQDKIQEEPIGSIICVTGPIDMKGDEKYWVGICCKYSDDQFQNLTIKLRCENKSSFRDIHDKFIEISFEEALNLAYQLIKNPNKKIIL